MDAPQPPVDLQYGFGTPSVAPQRDDISPRLATLTKVVPAPSLELMSPEDVAEWVVSPVGRGAAAMVITCRGRYREADLAVAEMGNWSAREPGSRLRVLDIGAGVWPEGSPTTHDLHHTITESGLLPEITVVDVNIPAGLNETRPGIGYQTDFAGITGEFDVVRILNVIEHVSLETYEGLRTEAMNHLRDGGFFVATQEAPPENHRHYPEHQPAPSISGYSTHNGEWYTPNTKVAQRRGDTMVPVGLFPAAVAAYREQRQRLLDRWMTAVDRIAAAGPQALDHECVGTLHLQGKLSNETWDPLAVMAREAKAAPRFAGLG